MQKSFRVDFTGDTPVWRSNDDGFWKPIKAYVFKLDENVVASEIASTVNLNSAAEQPSTQPILSRIVANFLRQSIFAKIGIIAILLPTFAFSAWRVVGGVAGQFFVSHAPIGKDRMGNEWAPPVSGAWACDNATQNRPWGTLTLSSDGTFKWEGVEGMAKITGQYRWEGGSLFHEIVPNDSFLTQSWGVIQGGSDQWLMANNYFQVICHK
jgi:hypothetical protein